MATKIKVITIKNKSVKKAPKAKKTTKKKATKKVVITKNILIGELVSKYPQASEVLMKYGLHCVGCMLSPYESLEAGVAVHGIPLKLLLNDLNKVVTKSSAKGEAPLIAGPRTGRSARKTNKK